MASATSILGRVILASNERRFGANLREIQQTYCSDLARRTWIYRRVFDCLFDYPVSHVLTGLLWDGAFVSFVGAVCWERVSIGAALLGGLWVVWFG